MENANLVIRGAREHNLRSVALDLPRNRLIVFSGVSGSGKSSLAFDTLYAEGQRRYVESLSSYARQFLGQLPKPDVDYLSGLSPAISIQQKTVGRNPRSTVGTITEIHDYLRVLYARIGRGYCPECGRPITAQSREQILARIQALPEGTPFLVLAPLIRGQKGEYKDLFADLLRRGYVRARVDGQVVRLNDDLRLDRRIKHHIEVVIDRLRNEPRIRPRLAEAVEQALELGQGTVLIALEANEAPGEAAEALPRSRGSELLLSAHYACTHCQRSYEPPSPQLFSFNSPQGMCPECEGLGTCYTFDPELLVPDPSRSFAAGAVVLVGPLRQMGRWRRHIYEGVARTLGIDLHQPWKELSPQQRHWLLYGAGERHITFEWRLRGGGIWRHGGTWEGIIPQLLRSFKKTAAGPRRAQLEKYLRTSRCPSCQGQRLNPQARAVRVGGKTLVEVCALPLAELAQWLALAGPLEQALTPLERLVAGELLKEIRGRVDFLLQVGLDYLSLDRPAPTLSGGEAQRIRLAGQIGSGLTGVLYILDEPSIGLHPRDNQRLLQSLQRLRDQGNTVLVVEHDEETIRAADYVVDFGPGPGSRGGQVVAAGSLAQVLATPASLTGQYLSGKKQIPLPSQRRPPGERFLEVRGARHNNLKNLCVRIPLGLFVCVTGVSGSGKSSLVNDVLYRALVRRYRKGEKAAADGEEVSETEPEEDWVGAHDALLGVEHLDKVIAIDQAPIGRTPRSNPATYVKVFDEIRALYAQLPESRARGYAPGRFSFNKPGGRCEACQGYGANRLEMDFLADVWVPCAVCQGKRFNRETLQIRYKDKNIADVLALEVAEAVQHFAAQPRIHRMLGTLQEVGLDYLQLGQPSPTLSGGEAQRIKLARELCKRSTGRTLYVLDEPTTGLHFDDIAKLLSILHRLVEAGNTVLVIEHNLEVVKTADWVIDLGPEGGAGGGRIVAEGPPEVIAACPHSYTGQALRPVLARGAATDRSAPVRPAPAPSPKRARRLLARPAPPRWITVRGAQQHNLKNLQVRLPRGGITVCCGPSGSGKSSFAVDTLYAEGRRRYVESLSAYARQFLGQVQKPKVESVTGLSPAISIEQQAASKSPRSTVGTVTEIYDYLRILYARLGQPYCPACQLPIGTQTTDEIIDRLLALPEGTRLFLLAPLERRGQTSYAALWEEVRRSGFARIRVDGRSYSVEAPPAIDHRRKHQVEVVVDRLVIRRNQRSRLADAVETALEVGRGVLHVARVVEELEEPAWPLERYSQHLACPRCRRSFEPLTPHHFSFNAAVGWCPACEGLGVQRGVDPHLFLRDARLSLRAGALAAWPALTEDSPFLAVAQALAHRFGFSLDTPYAELSPAQQQVLLFGAGEEWLPLELPAQRPAVSLRFQYKGLLPAVDEATRVSFVYRQRLGAIVREVPCSACGGSRLRPEAAACRFQGYTIHDLCQIPLGQCLTFFQQLALDGPQQQIAGEVLRHIRERLRFLVDVGLEYLTLARPAPTLSGGEAQRIRLASQLGSGLTGVLYVLDEPTIGLHPRDNQRLLTALRRLRDLGNTLVIVEHDREVIAAADYVLDFGPGAGAEGGEIVAQGTPRQIQRCRRSLTGQYLSGKKSIPIPRPRRPAQGPALVVRGARQNNLKNLDVAFPLGCFVAVTGVSGSGKSSLVQDVLYAALARQLHRAQVPVGRYEEIIGLDQIDKVIYVDQQPIGQSPSSNPATYTGVFDLIREFFAQLPEARLRGYSPRRFSFNEPGGRCEACQGLGQKKIEMHFLPDVWVDCDVCQGSRYTPETLAVRYQGKSIADVLRLRVAEAYELFAPFPKIRRLLQTLLDVGLGYLPLGQAAPTLSGGEAQRVKLAAELGRPNTGRTLYVLDEPTTGLHFEDIRKLLEVLHRLVDLGNTVVVVEHNLEVIKTADWVIDLGPEAGDAGGYLVAAGTPEEVAQVAGSHTGAALAPVLAAGPYVERPRSVPPAAEEDTPEAQAEPQQAVRMPWEVDGRRWHLEQRLSYQGRPCRWDGQALAWVEEQVHALGDFAPTHWNHRSVVEIAARGGPWFLHAHTALEWVVRLVFRVARHTFRQEELARRLGLRPLDEIEELPVYDQRQRVQVSNRKGPWQEVSLLVHSRQEIATPAFRQFLQQAVASFQTQCQRLQTRPEDVMPWKVHGQRWHLSDKGFPIGQRPQWERTLLTRLLELVQQVEPQLEIVWNNREYITLKVPGIGRGWAQWRTKEIYGLDCRFLGKPGQFNLSQLEGIGACAELHSRRTGDVLRLVFQQEEQLQPARLLPLLREHLRGFREKFSRSFSELSARSA
jgi:excinuclease ABC subunit A